MVWVYQSLRKVNGPRLLSNIGYTWDFHSFSFFRGLDMDMEMSGVAAWSFFFVSTPPRSTASGLHSFGFSFFIRFYFYFYFRLCSYSEDTKYMNNEQQ